MEHQLARKTKPAPDTNAGWRLAARPAKTQGESTTVPACVRDVLRSPGEPLDAATRAYMEPRFGQDFSQVRVHADAKAAESARAKDAIAYAVGQHVVFRENHFAPDNRTGKQLLAHELAHTVQQSSRRSGVSLAGDLRLGHPADIQEQHASVVAEHVAGGAAVPAGLRQIGVNAGEKTVMCQRAADKEQKKLTSPIFAGIAELEMALNGNLVIGPGASGEFVRRIQIALLAMSPNLLPKFGPDGHFGAETQAAVALYQKTHCVGFSHGKKTQLASDGVIGSETMRCLEWSATMLSAADMAAVASHSEGKVDLGFASGFESDELRDAGIDFAIDKGRDLIAKGLDWRAEKISERLVEKGYKVDNFGKMRKSSGKTKSGKWKEMGGKTRRGKFTTRSGGKPYSRLAKGMKASSKFLDEAVGPAMSAVDMRSAMEGKSSPIDHIVDILAYGLPISMVGRDQLEKLDDELFETALNAGYESTVRYIENCRSCREMTADMAMLYVTAAEYEAAFRGTLVVTESLRLRILPVFKETKSGLEHYQKTADVQSPLEFAILLNRSQAEKAMTVNPIAGFPVPH